MALSVAMMLTMFPTGVLADDFDYDEGNTAGVTVSAEGQSDENQGEGESASIVSEEPAPVESEDQTTDPVESASQETQPVESEDQTTDPVESESQTTETVESESQATEPAASASQATDTVESESQTTDPAASSSQAAEPEEKDNSVNTADLYDPQPTDITAKQTTINVGQSLVDLTGSGVGGYGGTPVHQWSTEDETVATVTGNGSKATVTGVGVGKTKISHYCYREFYGWKTNEKTETIEIEVVAKVTDASIQVKDDASATSVTFSKYATPPVLEAVVTPTDAAYKSCAWSVDRSDVLEVNAETGEITAKSMGEATVTLTVTNYDDSEVKATLPVTVTNPIPTSAVITVTEGKADDLYPQDTLTLVPGVEPGSADEYNCAWVSSDAEVATVAGDATEATVTAMKDGTATITLTVTPKSAEAAASADEASPAADAAQSVKTAEITVKVNAVTPAESVTIRSDKETVRVRETVQFTAAVNPTNAQGSYEWKTDNRQVLSIDKNGLATGEAAGTANVTVTFKGKDGNEITSDPIKITVTPAAQQYKREALVYYLKDPTKDANSNASDQWGPGSLGTATVDVAGATWANDKNCFNVKGRVISWPEGYGDGVVPRDTTSGSVWMTIFANYKESVQKELKRTITTNDVEEIWLEPAKISKDNGTTPDMHLDCNVRIKCHDIVMVRFMVQDVNDPTAIQVKAMNRVANSTVSATDVPSYPATKEDGKYAFRGWYLNSDFSGSEIPFEPDYQLGKDNVTFYGRYVQQHTVTYKLDENAANAYATDNVYADDTHTVIAAPTKDGYEFTGWKLDESTTYQPGNTFKMPNSDVTLVAQWKATTRSYTVNYYWNGTTTKVAEPSTGTANVGEKIENLTPVPVEGYTPVSTESKSITIDEDATKNVITFFYYKDVTLTANSATETYDGTAKSVSGFTGAPEDADFSAITVVATGTNADTYPANFPERTVDTVDAAGKYIVTAAENGKLTIAKRTVTLKSADLNKKYDGTALVNGETALETETGWAEGEGATYTFTGSQTLVGSSANAFSYTLNDGTKADNYEIAKTEGTLTVENRAENEKYEITVTAKSDTKTYNGREQNVTGIVTNEFTVNGQKYIVSGLTAEAKGTDVDTYTTTVTGTAVVTDNLGHDVTAQFTVKPENGTLTIKAKKVTITAKDNTGITYDGHSHGGNGYEATEVAEGDKIDSVTISGSKVDAGVYNDALVPSDAKIINANGRDVTQNYEFTYTKGKLEIKPVTDEVTVTIEGNSHTVSYNGNPQSVEGYKVVSISNNLYKEANFTFTGEAKATGTEANTYAMGLAENQFTNTSANFEHVKFVVTDGKLVITPKNIVPGENSKLSVTAPNEVIYNGQSQKQPPVVMDDTVTLVEGKDYDLSYSSDTTNAGDVTITVTGKGNYSGVTTVSYKITPRGVLLTSASAHKEYDGTPLTKDGAIDHYFYFDENGEIVETLANGFVAGEVTEIHATGSVTNVSDGEVTNTITYKTGEKFNENNYTITKNEGKLYITPVTDEVVVSITGKNDTVTYNGNPQSVEGYGYTVKIAGNPSDLYKDTDFTFTGKAKATGTDADTYAMGLAENQFANTSANFTNVKFSVEDGWLRINPREGVVVTIKGNTDTVPYDGNPHTVEGYTVEFTKNPDDLYKEADFQLNGKAQAAGTNAGTYYMGFVATSFENTNPNFKNVVFNITDGWLKITPKNIVPGENNKDLTATAPEDVVYSGESQQQKPIVKDGDKVLEEGKDYDLSYSEDTTNVGTVTVTINGNGNYGSKFEVTYKITPAPLKITTNSAEKTYDGSALTAGGKIEGLVKDETATLKTTGSQTEVGESKNTYEIEWGTAKETNYKIAEEDIGTLKVNARSGGGSSSKPTPEEEPTPTPTPTPLPTLPTTPAPTTPARRVTRSTATVTEPASRPTEQITENETPKAESEPEVIEDEETPLAPMATGAWALVNLILMLLTVLASLLLLLGYLGKKKYAKEDEYGNALHDANGNEIIDYTRNKKGFWRVASLIPAVAAVIAFALTENMRLPMVMTDRWTLLMVIIAVVQLIVAVLCKKKKESEEDENQANA